jgi:hypothetical protein
MSEREPTSKEYELAAQQIATCDLCGNTVMGPRLQVLAGKPDTGEPVESVYVCEDCWLRIKREEVPFEAEIEAGLQPADE